MSAGRSVGGGGPGVPVATYRLQFRDGMTFDRAIGLIPHWTTLGISHLYASPLFSAVAGSTHGYDVTDPNEIDPALGGMDGFRRLSNALLAADLGLILDIVPNHMAASLENPYWRDLLKWGRRSRHAPIFDVDWEQKLTLPVLGDEPLEALVAEGKAKLSGTPDMGELVFDYHGSHYPIDPSTYFAAPETAQDGHGPTVAATLALLDRQPWRMIHWREAASGLSYRRFFEITGLVGVRVEDETVFDETHRLVLDLVAEGRVQGLRIDHIDGLADPHGYLRRLRDAVGPEVYIVVEKILEGDESLPADWPVAGTTGYEFIADLASLLTAPAPELDRAWQDAAPDFGPPERELVRAKRLMVDVNFAGEVASLIRRATRLADEAGRPDLSPEMLAEAVRALVAGFEFYRTYGTAKGIAAQDTHVLEDIIARLSQASPQLNPALAFLADILFERLEPVFRDAAVTFRTRLQHLTGPVLAKSLEDTFFYRYNRLIALNEVGGNPMADPGGVEYFHRRMQERRRSQLNAVISTSTHDTKRGEDARARLYAISEAPAEWTLLTRQWRQQLAGAVTSLPGGPAPEPAVEWLVFQALAGMLPVDFDPGDPRARQQVRDRFLPYIEKALREAKLRTNWTDVKKDYETAVAIYAAVAIGSVYFMRGFWRDIQPFVRTGLVNSLTQTLLKLTAPGVPDIYQGTEDADTSLVDPDNRRIPDYDRLMRPEPDSFAAAKSGLIRSALSLRGRHPELFASGDYVALETTGRRADNIVAFARMHGSQLAIVVAPRLVHEAVAADTLLSPVYWEDTAVRLPDGVDSLTDVDGAGCGGAMEVASLFRDRAFALLVGEN